LVEKKNSLKPKPCQAETWVGLWLEECEAEAAGLQAKAGAYKPSQAVESLNTAKGEPIRKQLLSIISDTAIGSLPVVVQVSTKQPSSAPSSSDGKSVMGIHRLYVI
jgi:hypothetical protein